MSVKGQRGSTPTEEIKSTVAEKYDKLAELERCISCLENAEKDGPLCVPACVTFGGAS